jgi:GT2 family glycosyltransferase
MLPPNTAAVEKAKYQHARAEARPAVLMSAWRAERWILAAVASVRRQAVPVDLRVGVDGCERTAEALRAAGEPFYWSPENVGPYLVRNSLAAVAPASHFLIFDADDVMDPDYVQRLTEVAGDDGLAGCGRRLWRDEDGPIPADPSGLRTAPFDTGRPTISAAAWKRLGGFGDYRVSGDTDLWWRARDMGLPLRVLKSAHLTARLHPGSQMADPETCLTSPLRSAAFAEIFEGLVAGRLVVEPATVPLEEAA